MVQPCSSSKGCVYKEKELGVFHELTILGKATEEMITE